MSRSVFIFLFLSAFVFDSLSQNFEKGHFISAGKDKFFNRVIGEDKNGFYSLRYNFKGYDKRYYINQYNKVSLNKIRTIDIGVYNLEEEVYRGSGRGSGSSKIIIDMFILKEKIYIFSKLYSSLVADIYSTVNGEALVLDSVLTYIVEYRNATNIRRFFLNLSSDSTKILSVALYSISGHRQTTATLYSLNDFKKIWEKELMKTFDGHLIKPRECRVDAGDNLYYSFVSMEDEFKEGYYGVGLAFMDKNALKESILSFNLHNSVPLYNPSVEYIKEDDAFYFCYNFKDPKFIKNRNLGIIYSKVSAKEHVIEFTDTIYFSEKNKSTLFCDSSRKNIDRCVFAPVKIKKINGFTCFYTYIDSYEMRVNRLYHSSNIIAVFGIKRSGEKAWQTLLPRSTFFNFVTENNDLTGIQVFTIDNKLNFLFIDNEANETILNNDGSFDYCKMIPSGYISGTNLKLMSIDESGKITSKILFKNDKEWVLPALINIPSNDGRQIIRYKTASGEGFGKLTIN